MNKQNQFHQISGKTIFLLCVGLFLFGTNLIAQSYLEARDYVKTISFSDSDALHYKDYIMPLPTYKNKKIAYFSVKGGDGGEARDKGKNGGGGAIMSALVKIGEEGIPAGSTVRFIIGRRGRSRANFGSGGGGTGIVWKGPDDGDEWQVLMVAGGGGGACNKHSGLPASIEERGRGINNGSTTKYTNDGGTEGNGAIGHYVTTGGNGGGIYSPGKYYLDYGLSGQKLTTDARSGQAGIVEGEPVGSEGGSGDADGGFGFGSGGIGANDGFQGYGGGGGGGYTGGGAGHYGFQSGGGGSYINYSHIVSLSYHRVETPGTDNPAHGYGQYQLFTDEEEAFNAFPAQVTMIQLKTNTDKCLDVDGGNTNSGANIQLWDCNEGVAQNWIFDWEMVKLEKDQSKCLEIQGSTPSKGANVELWTCNEGASEQKWIYDGVNRAIRPITNLKYCVDVNGVIGTGNNLQLWTCNGTANQQWVTKGATTADLSAPAQAIRMAIREDRCIDVDGVIGTGNNLQLWSCNGTANQQWTFDDMQIKLKTAPGKCLDLNQSGTGNGTNIQLYDCNGTDAQQWVYDGFTKTFRSKVNANKCLDISGGNTAKGTNIQLWDCQSGNTNQQFVIN